ncbi:hypothetical protein COU59_01915 [Candidatus Pacearchaeota archaeon CG10_big_fil_rev_8_21_14_0_10_34_12]|nr:MAG: hypothetical protein COU59_01915 [Candidatus Pacearchaeota archaeon CG10_big_fil_rev_8_21_14_0_10_34_12]
MEKIYSKTNPKILLHVLNKKEDITSQRNSLSPEDEFLQVACLSADEGKTIFPHKHLECRKIVSMNQESWIVIEGIIKVTLYDLDDMVLKEEILKQGDCLITFRGAHSFVSLEEGTKIYEYKTGPYEGKEKDYVSIDS